MVTFHPSPGADQFKIRENVRDGVNGHQAIKKRKKTSLIKTTLSGEISRPTEMRCSVVTGIFPASN